MNRAALGMLAEACRLFAAGLDALGRDQGTTQLTGSRPRSAKRTAQREAAQPDVPPTEIDRQRAREALRRHGVRLLKS